MQFASKCFPGGGKVVIVNLQKTPKDKQASLVIHGFIDKVQYLTDYDGRNPKLSSYRNTVMLFTTGGSEAEWGPLRHVRVIKERNSGGFAFIDFPTTGSARSMIDKVGDEGLLVDVSQLEEPVDLSSGQTGHMNHRSTMLLSDWMCTICGCVNLPGGHHVFSLVVKSQLQ